MTFNRTEQESIILNAVWSQIDEMVNFAIFMPLTDKLEDTNLMPRTSDTRRLFNILLGDFLSSLVKKGKRACRSDCPRRPPKRDCLTSRFSSTYVRSARIPGWVMM